MHEKVRLDVLKLRMNVSMTSKIHRPSSSSNRLSAVALPLLFLGLCSLLTAGQNSVVSTQNYLYAVDGGAPATLWVYDLNNGFNLVKQISIPIHYTGFGIRGFVISAATSVLYISHGCYYDLSSYCKGIGGYLAKYDLATDQLIWDKSYPFGVDSFSVSANGQTIYMPVGERSSSALWEIIDSNGNVTGSINTGQTGPHNTIVSNSGAHVYMGSTQANYLVVANSSNNSVIQKIGPTVNGVRPFTINSKETLAFTTSTGLLGFQVGDIVTGKILYTVSVPGNFVAKCPASLGQPCSHGISLSPDDKEIYLVDKYNNYVHVFDVSNLPGAVPALLASIPLTHAYADSGWITHSRDGRHVFVGDSGDVIDTSTRSIVGYMPGLNQTSKFQELWLQNGTPTFAPLSRSGVGYATTPSSSTVTLSATSLTFGTQTIGTTSTPQSATLSNTGTSAVSIASVAIAGADPGDFHETNTCGSSLAAQSNCTITVTFSPTVSGARTASVTITDSDSSSPQSISLSGSGASPATGPAAKVSPTSLSFSAQTVGSTSSGQAVTLSNPGGASLQITNISITGDFSFTDNCGASVAVGAQCTIILVFKPTATGTRTGTLSVSDDAPGSPHTVMLSGVGSSSSTAVNHYVYVVAPGLIYVYDMDNGFALSKTLSVPPTRTMGPIQLRGAVGDAASGKFYISYGGDVSGASLLQYSLVSNSVVWSKTYSFGADSMSISPDGTKIYFPTGEGAYTQGVWQIIDTNSGNPIGQINSGGGGPHNTITNFSGTHVYLGPRYSNNVVLANTNPPSVVRNIGPVSGGVRPFTINSAETLAFITTSGKVGFYYADINTGKILSWICPPGYCWTSGSYNGISGVSHGISLSPDETELYLLDLPYNRVHVFNVSNLPATAPVDVADIPLNCKLPNEGWLQHSRDGRFVIVGDCGDVIDTSTRKIVANMPQLLNTRIWNEVDFSNGVPSFTPLSRNQGGYKNQP